MSAAAETAVNAALKTARDFRGALEVATRHERTATVAFMDEARASGWDWESVGRELGISGNAARRYYARNRRKVRSV
jgi:hypothetical protein